MGKTDQVMGLNDKGAAGAAGSPHLITGEPGRFVLDRVDAMIVPAPLARTYGPHDRCWTRWRGWPLQRRTARAGKPTRCIRILASRITAAQLGSVHSLHAAHGTIADRRDRNQVPASNAIAAERAHHLQAAAALLLERECAKYRRLMSRIGWGRTRGEYYARFTRLEFAHDEIVDDPVLDVAAARVPMAARFRQRELDSGGHTTGPVPMPKLVGYLWASVRVVIYYKPCGPYWIRRIEFTVRHRYVERVVADYNLMSAPASSIIRQVAAKVMPHAASLAAAINEARDAAAEPTPRGLPEETGIALARAALHARTARKLARVEREIAARGSFSLATVGRDLLRTLTRAGASEKVGRDAWRPTGQLEFVLAATPDKRLRRMADWLETLARGGWVTNGTPTQAVCDALRRADLLVSTVKGKWRAADPVGSGLRQLALRMRDHLAQRAEHPTSIRLPRRGRAG